ncbi:MAG: YtxH domain-containing protein [Xanthomarina sp.]
MLIAILASAAVGAGLGILYAPNKGTKSRRKIKHGVTDATQDVSDWFKHAKDDLVKTAYMNKKNIEKKIE